MNRRFLKNATWIIAAKIVQLLIGLFVSAMSARYLGPANVGTIDYVASFVAFFTSFATLGLNNVIVKELIDRQDDGKVLGTSIIMRMMSSLLSMICVIALIVILNPNDKTMLAVTVLQSVSLIFQSLEMFNFWYQSKLQSRTSSIIQTISYILVAGYRLYCLATSRNVLWFAFATTLDSLIVGVLLYFSYHKNSGHVLAYDRGLAKSMFADSHHFIYSGLMVAIYSQMDKLMIKQMIDISSVGQYGIATGINTMWSFLLQAIIDSMYPLIVEAKKQQDTVRYNRRIVQLYSIVLWSSIALSTIITLCSHFIVMTLYGSQYLPAVSVLKIYTWVNTFAYLGVARGAWMVCENNQKYQKVILGIGCLTNLVLNALMIPVWGIAGAAVATLITQIVTSFVAPMCIPATRVNSFFILKALNPIHILDHD